jgi:hypothetical protein
VTANRIRLSITLVLVLGASSAACGKRGDPLAPLRLIPQQVGELSARRSAQQVELHFTLPSANANGPGPLDLDHVEVYAITVAPGAVTPPNRDLLTKARIVGTIPVKPPPVEGAPEPPVPDKRPGPGDRITFVEELNEATMKPAPLPQAPVAAPAATPTAAAPTAAAPGADAPPTPTGAAAPATTPPPAAPPVTAPGTSTPGLFPPGVVAPAGTTPETPAGAAAAPAAPAAAPPPPPPVAIQYLTRIYVVRGLSRSGRPGPPSVRASVPLVSPIAAPTAVAAQMPSEKGVVVDWTPPVAEPGGAAIAFNVYRRETPNAPLNPSPLTTPSLEIANESYGTEHCYVVRAIQTTQNVTVESEPSAPACLTPLDKFPPVAPKNLRAVAEEGAVSLVWDANAEPDLAGYLVLRGDAAGGTLQPITPQPIKEASYRDTTVTPGVRYAYAVVAVDNAPTRNSSPQSAQESVTAR